MRQVVHNKYIRASVFSSSEEALSFLKSQHARYSLSIEDTSGDNYYCYVCYHSLTKEKLFVLSFRSDDSHDNLSFLFWNSSFVLDTGENVYLVDENLNIKAFFEITTPLIGLYTISHEKMLLLEEAYMRVIDYSGRILKSELFDLIEDFSIKDNVLFIQTSKENKIIELS